MPAHDESRPFDVLASPCDLKIYYRGMPIDHGPLPALFYFALSGIESLTLDPINQPVALMMGKKMRVYSFTLPGHEANQDKTKAIAYWGEQLHSDPQFLDSFIDRCLQNIDFLIEENLVDPEKIAVAGLSRGGYIAMRIAAKHPRIKVVLGLAPLTELARLDNFKDLWPGVKALNLTEEAPALYDKHMRFYIGNRDLIVGTDRCFHLMQVVTEYAYEKGIRSPHIELMISPSIGHRGHGTSQAIFQSGAHWIMNQLQLEDI